MTALRPTGRQSLMMILLLALALVAAACNGEPVTQEDPEEAPAEEPEEPDEEPAPDEPAEEEPAEITDPIRIGVSAELTGPGADAAEALVQGVEIATDQVNEAGGINGRQIELVSRDTETDPSRGQAIIREFGEREQVVAGIGGVISTVVAAQASVIAEEEFPFIVTLSNVPQSVEDGLPWTFGVRMTALGTAEYARDYALEHLDSSNWAILAESGAFGQGAIEAMTEALAEIGEEPLAVETFELPDTDMTAQVTRARDAGADLVYLFGIGASTGYVIRDMQRIGWDAHVIGESSLVQGVVPEVAGPASNGALAIQTALLTGDDARPQANDLAEEFQERYGRLPAIPFLAAQTYDAAMILFQAIETADLTGDLQADREAIRDALETGGLSHEGVIKDYDPPFTPDNHDALTVEDRVMGMWQDGQMVLAPDQL